MDSLDRVGSNIARVPGKKGFSRPRRCQFILGRCLSKPETHASPSASRKDELIFFQCAHHTPSHLGVVLLLKINRFDIHRAWKMDEQNVSKGSRSPGTDQFVGVSAAGSKCELLVRAVVYRKSSARCGKFMSGLTRRLPRPLLLLSVQCLSIQPPAHALQANLAWGNNITPLPPLMLQLALPARLPLLCLSFCSESRVRTL